MNNENLHRTKSILAYVSISIAAAALFYAGAASISASQSDIILGIIWIFSLTMIISASIVPPLLKKREE